MPPVPPLSFHRAASAGFHCFSSLIGHADIVFRHYAPYFAFSFHIDFLLSQRSLPLRCHAAFHATPDSLHYFDAARRFSFFASSIIFSVT